MGRRPKERAPDIGEIVYLKTDPEKLPRLVVSFKVHPSGMIKYKLMKGDQGSKHWEFEIEKTVQERLKVKGLVK